MSVVEFMHRHHVDCDHRFAAAEAAVRRGDWGQALPLLEGFVGATDAHFEAEESVLFPAFEAAVGHAGGPTQVMRIEHRQMRPLFGQMLAACRAGDEGAFTGAADTLLVLMQQHNLKEEHILYPMCDQVLAAGDMVDGLRECLGEACPA